MKILSLYLWHNSTIAYARDGKLLYVLNEEKFDNIKNSDNFPIKSLQYLAQHENLQDLDKVVIVGKAINRWMLRYIENYTKTDKHKIIHFSVTIYDRLLYAAMKYTPRLMNWINDLYIRWRQIRYADKEIALIEQWIWCKLPADRYSFVSHHLCHTLSVLYFYGLHLKSEPTLVFTLDGGWDKNCATVRVRDKGEVTTLATVRNRYSLGDIWSKAFTGWLGMQPLEHEYKVMWLAAYSEEKYYQSAYEKLFQNTIDLNGLTWRSRIPGNKAHIYYHNKLWGLRFDNIAGALQKFTEETVIQWIKNGVEQTGIKKIALAGGVFMNVKLNKRIQEQPWLEKVYFMPSAWDESTPLGGIMAGHMETKTPLEQLEPINSMYHGLKYTDEQTTAFWSKYEDSYHVQRFASQQELINATVSLLESFEPVALFQSAGERWARSLCNRAILWNASNLETFHKINDMIKMRDFWMPFAPAILEEWAEKYIADRDTLKSKVYESSFYMINAFDSTPLAQQHLKAALHQKDKTLRPQLVTNDSNPFMYKLLKTYEQKTGMWGCMNTSLNMHGYPLVGTLEQAKFTLDNSGLNYMVIDNVLVSKKAW